MKARAEFVLKELFFPFALDTTAVGRHLKKRGNSEWRRPLSVTTPTFGNVMAYFQCSVTGVADLCPMTTGSLVQLFSRFAYVRFVASSAEYDINDV